MSWQEPNTPRSAHRLGSPPVRVSGGTGYVASCTCGVPFHAPSKDVCWDLLTNHTMPFVYAALGMGPYEPIS